MAKLKLLLDKEREKEKEKGLKRFLRKMPKPGQVGANGRLLILSFLIAFFLWVYIAASVSPTTTVSIKNIPVTVDLTGTKAESYELSLLDKNAYDDLIVDCEITGSRTAIGGLNRNDVEAYIDFDSTVSSSIGDQTLPIRLRAVGGSEFSNYTLTKREVTVSMDRFDTRTFVIEPEQVSYPGITAADSDVVINDAGISIDPPTVDIYGPSTELSKLEDVRVVVQHIEAISQRKKIGGCELQLVDSSGLELSKAPFHISSSSFTVDIPVKYYRVLPLNILIQNAPEGFDTEALLSRVRLNGSYTLPGCGDNPLNITIETENPANKAKLDELDFWTIDKPVVSSLSINSEKPREVEISKTLEEGFTDSSNLGTVMITIDSEGLTAQTFWIKNSDIVLMNGSKYYDYALQSRDGQTPVTLIGTPEDLEKIDATVMQASVNLLNASVSGEGTVTTPFSVTLTNQEEVSSVWISPPPQVNITVTEVDS